MRSPISTVVALGPQGGRDALEAAFLGEARIALAGFVPAARDALGELGRHRHDALVVACAGDTPETLAFITAAAAERPERPVVVVCDANANGFVAQAIEAGADDLVSDGAGAALGRDLAFALEKALARRTGWAGPAAHAKIITMLGPKGGTGKTLTTCNLAGALARAGQRVIVADLDLQFGDVGLAFGLSPERTIYDLATSGGSLDAGKVEDFLAAHESGVRVLLAPRRPDHAGAVGIGFLRELFATLREMADVVVVDTPPSFSPEVIAAIDCSTEVCVVAMLDALSLKNTKLALETLARMGCSDDRVRIVLNRSDSRVGVTSDDVAALLGRGPDVSVPSHRDITRSVNEATPIVLTRGHAEARRAFEALAALYLPPGDAAADAAHQPEARRRWRRRRRES